ncbi:MAG: hypothetical protein SW833_00095 [Cyanobacteriota bacterium]|nr:hypothetical protein [Cyanobacteriota bacterium]
MRLRVEIAFPHGLRSRLLYCFRIWGQVGYLFHEVIDSERKFSRSRNRLYHRRSPKPEPDSPLNRKQYWMRAIAPPIFGNSNRDRASPHPRDRVPSISLTSPSRSFILP